MSENRLCVNVSSVMVPYRASETQAENGPENLDDSDPDSDAADDVRALLQKLLDGGRARPVMKVSVIRVSTIWYSFVAATARIRSVLQPHVRKLIKPAAFQPALHGVDGFRLLVVSSISVERVLEALVHHVAEVLLFALVELDEGVHPDGNLDDEDDQEDDGISCQHARALLDSAAAAAEGGDEYYGADDDGQHWSDADIGWKLVRGSAIVEFVQDPDDDQGQACQREDEVRQEHEVLD